MKDKYTKLTDEQKQLIDFRDRFHELQENVAEGISTSKLKLTAVVAREYADYNYIQRMWKLAGFKGSAKIKGLKIDESKISDNAIAIVGGGLDRTPNPEIIYNPTSEQIRDNSAYVPMMQMGMTLIGKDLEGRVFINPPSYGFAETIAYNSSDVNIDIDTPGSLFTDEHDFTVSEFFVAPVIIINGHKVSRQDVIQFMSYAQRGIHTGEPNENQKAKEAERYGILTELSKQTTGSRDVASFIYQSIAQDIIKSEDLQKLSVHISNLEKDWLK